MEARVIGPGTAFVVSVIAIVAVHGLLAWAFHRANSKAVQREERR
jgi:hypothetical protein